MALVIQLLLTFWMVYRLQEQSFSAFKRLALFLMPLIVPVVAVLRLAVAFTVEGNPDPNASAFNYNYLIGQGVLLVFAITFQLLFHFSIFSALWRARKPHK